jgi:hypothetical protein
MDDRKSDQGKHFRESTTTTRYNPQIAECKGSERIEREVKPLATGAYMTLIGEVLMDAVAPVKDKSS